MKRTQAVLASSSSALAAALPTGFFWTPLAMPSDTAFSTAFSVRPFFTAFRTAFSTLFAAFFFALSFAIFPHSYRRGRPLFFMVFLAVFFTAFFAGTFFAGFFAMAFFAAFLAGDFLAGAFLATAFLTTPFLAAFLAGVFWTAFLATAFFAGAFWAVFLIVAFFDGDFVRTSVTVVTAAPTAVLTELATSSAIAIPYPTASAAFSTIVFSSIFGSLIHCVRTQLRIVEAYRHYAHKSLVFFPNCWLLRVWQTCSAPRSRCLPPLFGALRVAVKNPQAHLRSGKEGNVF